VHQPQGRIQKGLHAFEVLRGAGLLSPAFLYSVARATRRHGASTAMGTAAAALTRPGELAVLDETGSTTFEGLYHRMLSIAHGLRDLGVGEASKIGLLARNHRGFIEALGGATLLGADTCFLNTGFAGPQLRDVLQREGIELVLYDDEFAGIVSAAGEDIVRVRVWREHDTPHTPASPAMWGEAGEAATSIDELVERYPATPVRRPSRPGRGTLLTSGTTGTPKGAQRSATSTDADSAIGMLDALPIRVGRRTLVSAPLFHAWGLAHMLMGTLLRSTFVLQRRFDPERVLEAIQRHRVEALIVVPVMLQRILALGEDVCGKYDTRSLQVTLSSGSALPGELALHWMDTFGDNLYNFYGSTEVAQATIAGPADLRAAPGTAGRVPVGTTVRILDHEGRPLQTGKTGRIFVGNKGQFEGYTGGGHKEMVDGLMSIGDMGHFDEEGRLFVEGRDDDMIVSGGENVFPSEVEDLLSDHPDILEVSVIGVPDDEFGQRLRAFVVAREGVTLDSDALRTLVRQELARHKVPRDVIALDEIPRNPAGKVLKRVLREHPGDA
jgi:fatty-acyl-CoA synthase